MINIHTFFIFVLKHSGGLAVGVLGAFKGYSDIYKLYGGGVSWESLFEPTIKLCEDGIRISKHLEISLEDDVELIKADPMLRYDNISCEYSSVYLYPKLIFVILQKNYVFYTILRHFL